jgi:hypothetical protein
MSMSAGCPYERLGVTFLASTVEIQTAFDTIKLAFDTHKNAFDRSYKFAELSYSFFERALSSAELFRR